MIRNVVRNEGDAGVDAEEGGDEEVGGRGGELSGWGHECAVYYRYCSKGIQQQ